MKRIYHGSCHCKAVRFEAGIDLTVGSDPVLMQGTRRCNCTFCYKSRFWKCFVRPADFRLTEGEGALTDYRGPESAWPEGEVNHPFCRRCGMRLFSKGHLEAFGGWFYCLNLAALDDATAEELAAVPIQYEDGLHDRYDEPPAIPHYL